MVQNRKTRTLASWQEDFRRQLSSQLYYVFVTHRFQDMGRQMYFYYLEWLFVYNQNKSGYLQITTLQFYYF